MHVEVDGKSYFVEWEHKTIEIPQSPETAQCWKIPRPVPPASHLDPQEITTCLIRDGGSPSPGDGTFPVIFTGVVVRYFRDTPNRDIARKESLKKALEDLSLAMFVDGSQAALARNVRFAFWVAFLTLKSERSPEAAVLAIAAELVLLCTHEAKVPYPGDRGDFFKSVIERALPLLARAARGISPSREELATMTLPVGSEALDVAARG